MKIAFVTTQSANGSTLIGRTLPVAKYIASKHEVHLLAFAPLPAVAGLTCHATGRDPFTRTRHGKKRLRSWPLLFNMLSSALSIAWHLGRINPDRVVIVKTLPHNVLGVRLWHLAHPRRRVIIDVDDFELTANRLTSFWQRASIHWAQRCAAHLSSHVITATPFLSDYFSNLRPAAAVTLIPTGLDPIAPPVYSAQPHLAYFGSLSISSGHRVDFLAEILSVTLKSFPHAKLIIAGTGDDEHALKESFVSLGIAQSVIWHGRFSQTDIPMLIKNTAIIVDPIDSSVANRAKSSFRVLLAASVGLPVVTSDVGLRPMLLPSSLHHRFFADPTPASMTSQIVNLLTNPLSPADRQLLVSHTAPYYWSRLAHDYQCILES